MTATKAKDYPEERPDWLMVDEYARQKSYFGCILCDKTHRAKDCEYKAKRTAVTDKKKKEEEQYSWFD